MALEQQVMAEMKEKGGPLMMRFEWACSFGEHNGYARMMGQSGHRSFI